MSGNWYFLQANLCCLKVSFTKSIKRLIWEKKCSVQNVLTYFTKEGWICWEAQRPRAVSTYLHWSQDMRKLRGKGTEKETEKGTGKGGKRDWKKGRERGRWKLSGKRCRNVKSYHCIPGCPCRVCVCRHRDNADRPGWAHRETCSSLCYTRSLL